MKVVETQRLQLRLIALQDVEHVHGLLYADPEVAVPWVGRVVSLRDVRSPRGLLSRIARDNDEPGLLAVDRAADHVMLGLAGVVPLTAGDAGRLDPPQPEDGIGSVEGRREAELTVALGRSYWNRGYATEAGQAVVRFAFQSLGLSRIVAPVSEDNERGVALLRRLGFRLESNRATATADGASPGLLGFLDAADRR